jgi:F0F1-type ATP synthase assembly protein I
LPEENVPKANPEKTENQAASRQYAMAMELPFLFVVAVVLGGGIGFFLDRWLHSKPIFLLVFGLAGFVGGLREVLRRVNASEDGSRGK